MDSQTPLSDSPSPLNDIYTLIVHGEHFELHHDQIIFDSPNYFTACFLLDFAESAKCTIRLSQNPTFFAVIVEYLDHGSGDRADRDHTYLFQDLSLAPQTPDLVFSGACEVIPGLGLGDSSSPMSPSIDRAPRGRPTPISASITPVRVRSPGASSGLDGRRKQARPSSYSKTLHGRLRSLSTLRELGQSPAPL
ncbi:hypothetical protein LXA43DRAFT_1091030 [Ganoderma leucocontextum]|nr:hypothetical protein LXA43DRAFT_1091030 [Ganoderma leucocontextum]